MLKTHYNQEEDEVRMRTTVLELDDHDTVDVAHFWIETKSIQGVNLLQGGQDAFLLLPACCSSSDCGLLFMLAQDIAALYPGAECRWTHNLRKVAISEENLVDLYAWSCEVLCNNLQPKGRRKTVSIPYASGCFYAKPHPSMELRDKIDHTALVIATILLSIHAYAAVERAPILEDGDGRTIAFLTNRCAQVVNASRYVAMVSRSGRCKMLSRQAFERLVDSRPEYNKIDEVRFALDPLPAHDWEDTFSRCRGRYIPKPSKRFLAANTGNMP